MEEGKRMRECKNEGVGQGRVVAGGRGVVNVGVSSKKGCRRCGCAVEEGMSSHVERKEKGGVRIERYEVKISIKVLLYFYWIMRDAAYT